MSGGSIVWDQSNEKPVACNDAASTLLDLNNSWSTENVSVAANALMAQMHESNFAPQKVSDMQQQQQQQQQGMWHYPTQVRINEQALCRLCTTGLNPNLHIVLFVTC
jgi:hypothetical protein